MAIQDILQLILYKFKVIDITKSTLNNQDSFGTVIYY